VTDTEIPEDGSFIIHLALLQQSANLLQVNDKEKTRRMVEIWKTTGPALAEVRDREMRAMTETQRIAAALDVLNLPGNKRNDQDILPEDSSGLVEQQYYFSKSWK
jgi:tRNA A37 N6-isopentenylltransferase MiaA